MARRSALGRTHDRLPHHPVGFELELRCLRRMETATCRGEPIILQCKRCLRQAAVGGNLSQIKALSVGPVLERS